MCSAIAAPWAADGVRRAEVYLHPAQLHVAAQPAQITTILGSCVAFCAWDGQRGVGGMSHFVLASAAAAPGPGALRFGRLAVPSLLDGLVRAGARRGSLLVKLFGGAQRFAGSGLANLGRANAELALRLAREEGLQVVSQDLGGSCGRKVVFNADTGAAWVRRFGE